MKKIHFEISDAIMEDIFDALANGEHYETTIEFDQPLEGRFDKVEIDAYKELSHGRCICECWAVDTANEDSVECDTNFHQDAAYWATTATDADWRDSYFENYVERD